MTKIYARPVLRVQGKLEAATQGQSTGRFTDADFPTKTPFEDLTFS